MSDESRLHVDTRDSSIDVSIVVPCYRDEEGLATLFARMSEVSPKLGVVELVIVDDGSPDRTAQRATELADGAPFHTTVVRLQRNFGQHPAVFAGFGVASGRTVVTMDSDLQYPPEAIPDLVSSLSLDYPVVSGRRQTRRDPIHRRVITSILGAWLRRQTGTQLQDFGSMFRAYDRTVIDQLLQFREQRRFVPALVAWLGVPVLEVPVLHAPRGSAGSRYRFRSLVDMMLDLVTGYSIFPLRAFVFIALIGSGVGFVGTASLAVYRIVIGAGIARLVSAFAALFFLLGIELLVLAMIGEYVGRIYIESKARPYYLIQKVTRL